MAPLQATTTITPVARQFYKMSRHCSQHASRLYGPTTSASSFTSSRSPCIRAHTSIQSSGSLSSLQIQPSNQCRRFGSSRVLFADPPAQQSPQAIQSSARSSLSSLSRALGLDDLASGRPSKSLEEYTTGYQPPGEHHLYIYSHKHNTQITLTGPQFTDPQTQRRKQHVIMTLSTGNIGYRKSNRGTYEAAFQLGSYVLNRIQLDGLLPKIQRLEVVLRGFGNGREALTKLLLGQEGAPIRDRVIRVVDASRIKMGGQRAKRPRRL